MKNFADKFNELRATIENEIYSADASVDNKGALRDMLATIKNELLEQVLESNLYLILDFH